MAASASLIPPLNKDFLVQFHHGLKKMLQMTEELISRQEQKVTQHIDKADTGEQGPESSVGGGMKKGKSKETENIEKVVVIGKSLTLNESGIESTDCARPLFLVNDDSIKPKPSRFTWLHMLEESPLKDVWATEPGLEDPRLTTLSENGRIIYSADCTHLRSRPSHELRQFMLHPALSCWQCIEFSALCIIAVESFLTPFQVFEPPRNLLFIFWDLLNAIYWTCRIIVSFRAGFYTAEGVVEMEPKHVAVAYLKSWFFIDSSCALVDWMSVANASASHFTILGSVKWLRLLKLVRLLKINQAVEAFREGKTSKMLQLIANLAASLGYFLCVSHLIACGWYAVGKYYTHSRDSWLMRQAADVTMSERSVGFRYMSSLHWALTQCTPASMEITPTNTAERLYNVIVVVLGMVSFSSLIASISASVNQLWRVNELEQKQDRMLRKYFRQYEVGRDLGCEVWHYIRYYRKYHRKHLCENEVDVLRTLPRSLLRDLREEVYTPILDVHPFFRHIRIFEALVRDIVNSALAQMHVLSASELFTEEQIASHMYFVFEGALTTRIPFENYGRQLASQDWIGELALWLHTPYGARAICNHFSELISVDGEVFAALACGVRLLHVYAERFQSSLARNRDLYCDMYPGFQAHTLHYMLEEEAQVLSI